MGAHGAGADYVAGVVGAVLLLQEGPQGTEADAGLQRFKVFGDYIDVDPLAPDGIQHSVDFVGGNAVARPDDFGIAPLADGIHHSPGSLIGAADADDHQHVRLPAHLFCQSLVPAQPLVAGPGGDIQPAKGLFVGILAFFDGLQQTGMLRHFRGDLLLGQQTRGIRYRKLQFFHVSILQ